MSTATLALNEPLRLAAMAVLTGRDNQHTHRVIREARPAVENLRTRDPATYQLVKKAIIEMIKRGVKPKRPRS
ncbi:MAG: hypothetical protein KIT79_03105 [Deltaproteobacteria bacterium]|nr:hypothetical protein [Deltaproteobacteria bacterium]